MKLKRVADYSAMPREWTLVDALERKLFRGTSEERIAALTYMLVTLIASLHATSKLTDASVLKLLGNEFEVMR